MTSQATPGPDHAAPRGKFSLWNYTEPAVLRAVVASVVSLAAALGITLPFDLPGIVEVVIPLLAVLVPIVQGITTRAAVVSPKRADLIAQGRAGTGLASGPA